MIAAYCSGGTGCFGNHCSCRATYAGGTETVFLRFREQPTYSSNTIPPADRIPPPDPKEVLKAKIRELRREETLMAQEWLAWFHDQEELEEGHLQVVHYKRPGRRRTCTAVRNFRGRP